MEKQRKANAEILYTKPKKAIGKSILYAGIVILWSFGYYKLLFGIGRLISLDEADRKAWGLLLQDIIVSLPVIVYLAYSIKHKMQKKTCLTMPGGKPARVILALACTVYLLLFFCSIMIIGAPVSALYMAIFYLFFVSLSEEFLYRGLLPSILAKNSPPVKWLLPNILFSLSHIVMLFVYDDGLETIFGEAPQVLYGIISGLIFGLLMELAKRKSGSLYIPVLLHAIYDLCGEMMLY